jgi:hypothetical protein
MAEQPENGIVGTKSYPESSK